MPQDPITQSSTFVEGEGHGAHDMVVLDQYIAPSDDDGRPAYDPFKAKDAEIKATMMAWLKRHYPGYPWATEADCAKRIVKFSIPILMGVDNWWVVNLRTHPDIIPAMAQGAGQILERYRLRRGAFQLIPFLEARERHSALVIPSRKVPT